MFKIQQITTDPLQKTTVILPDGTTFALTIQFMPQQYGWFIDELAYAKNGFKIQGARICVSPNLLYQFRNQIPFGLAVFTNDNNEPTLQEDFSSGYANLYVLTAAEVAAYTAFLAGG